MVNNHIDLPQALLLGRALVFHKVKFLLLKRSSLEDFNPEKWELPGGKLKIKQDPSHLIEEEVIREAGLSIEPINKYVFMDCTIETKEGSPYYEKPFITLTGFYRTETERVLLSDAHTEYRWATFADAITLDLTPAARKAILALEPEIKNYLWKFS